jgi:HD superfamily phosphohydrolase
MENRPAGAESSSFRQPDYPSERDVPRYRVRCPVHGFIRFSENERRIIDHPLFRRLRFIRQLALTEFIYPGATHTRFEHSLGVMEIASRAFDRLASAHGDLLERSFRQVAELRDRPLALARQVVRLAALLHDVGHACFSHAAEEVLHKDTGHEALTYFVVEEPDLLGRELEKGFFAGCASLVGKVLRGGGRLPPQLQVLRNLVSGEMDADRTDYLLRDSLHCGVDYGRFDYRRMIECLALSEGEGGVLEVGLQRDGIHTFEALILARYQMSTQVYYHRLRRIYDYYLRRYFEAKGAEMFDTPQKVLAQNDMTVLAEVFRDADAGGPAAEWAARIRDRNHHRVVFETGADATAFDVRRAEEMLARLRERFPDLDFHWDHARASIHALLLPGETDTDGLVLLPLVDGSGRPSFVGERSLVLRHVPRRFQVARIFCDVGRDRERRAEVTAFLRGERGGR